MNMRPGPNNKRSRGRGRGKHHGGGGGGGPRHQGGGSQHGQDQVFNIHRTIDSNGPDVKIRGNAHHVYEKYLQLARDANSSGDRVMAENYLQHAEHYNRIIAAAQAQMPIQNVQNQREASDDDIDDERDEFDGNANNQGQGNAAQPGQGDQQANQGRDSVGQGNGNGEYAQPEPVNLASGPQPEIEGMPAEVALNPEAAGEGNMVSAADVLVAEEQHLVPEQQGADFGDQVGVARGRAQVDVQDLSADRAGQRFHADPGRARDDGRCCRLRSGVGRYGHLGFLLFCSGSPGAGRPA